MEGLKAVAQLDMFAGEQKVRSRRRLPRVPALLQPPRGGTGLTLLERFQAFHAANPEVYMAIVEIARDLQNMGFERTGIGLIFERLRWLHALQTKGDEYKLNNNHRAFYARLIMGQEPDLDGFFHVREQKR